MKIKIDVSLSYINIQLAHQYWPKKYRSTSTQFFYFMYVGRLFESSWALMLSCTCVQLLIMLERRWWTNEICINLWVVTFIQSLKISGNFAENSMVHGKQIFMTMSTLEPGTIYPVRTTVDRGVRTYGREVVDYNLYGSKHLWFRFQIKIWSCPSSVTPSLGSSKEWCIRRRQGTTHTKNSSDAT